jgi:hypothetical protein
MGEISNKAQKQILLPWRNGCSKLSFQRRIREPKFINHECAEREKRETQGRHRPSSSRARQRRIGHSHFGKRLAAR